MIWVSAGLAVVQPLGGVATFQHAVHTCWQLCCRYLRPALATTLHQLTNLYLDTGLLGSFFSHSSCSLLSRACLPASATGYLRSPPSGIISVSLRPLTPSMPDLHLQQVRQFMTTFWSYLNCTGTLVTVT